jgi:Gram-negative bacterial TonB protein C-terminal
MPSNREQSRRALGRHTKVRLLPRAVEDGHVSEAAVLTAGRADLEKQAVQIASGWVFSPGVCNGMPVPLSADLVVHFPPR